MANRFWWNWLSDLKLPPTLCKYLLNRYHLSCMRDSERASSERRELFHDDLTNRKITFNPKGLRFWPDPMHIQEDDDSIAVLLLYITINIGTIQIHCIHISVCRGIIKVSKALLCVSVQTQQHGRGTLKNKENQIYTKKRGIFILHVSARRFPGLYLIYKGFG